MIEREAESLGMSRRALIIGGLKSSLLEAGWLAGSDLELLAAFYLKRYGFSPHDVKQEYAIRPDGCEHTYRIDFAWPQLKIAIEIDGWHHRSPAGAASDRERDSWLRREGWLVFRVDDEHGEEVMADQLARIARFIRSEQADLRGR